MTHDNDPIIESAAAPPTSAVVASTAKRDVIKVASETNPPADQSGAFESLHGNALWAFRIGQSVLAVVLWMPLLILSRLFLLPSLGVGASVSIAVAMLVLLMLWAWGLAKRRFLAVRLQLDATGLTICRGVYWQSETHIARSRVQHTDIQRGPLDRRLGLADLLVHTAGTSMATVRLSGLSVGRAQSLRDALLEGHDQHF